MPEVLKTRKIYSQPLGGILEVGREARLEFGLSRAPAAEGSDDREHSFCLCAGGLDGLSVASRGSHKLARFSQVWRDKFYRNVFACMHSREQKRRSETKFGIFTARPQRRGGRD